MYSLYFFTGLVSGDVDFLLQESAFASFFFDLVLTPKKKADFFNLVYGHQTQETPEQKLLQFLHLFP